MNPSIFDRFTRRAAFAAGAALAGGAALGGRLRASAQDDAPATPVASPTAGLTLASSSASFLFVQVAPDATWAPKEGAPGTYTLTLSHQDGQTIYFSDRPYRVVGAAPTQNVLDSLGFTLGFTLADPPNAAIVAGEEVLVVELTNPVYDPAAGTLAYDAVPLAPEAASAGLASLAARQTGAGLPDDLGPTSLYIDSACSQYTECWGNCQPYGGCASDYGAIPGGPVDACWDFGKLSCEACDGRSKDDLYAVCDNAYSACNDICTVRVGY